MDAQTQQLEQDRGHEGVERIEVAEAEEQEEAGEARRRRDDDRDLRPVPPAARPEPRQPGVEHADRDHRAGQRHAVVGEEGQQPRRSPPAARAGVSADEVLVVGQHDSRRRDGEGQHAAGSIPTPISSVQNQLISAAPLRHRLRARDRLGQVREIQRLVDALRQAGSAEDEAAVDGDEVGAGGEEIEGVLRLVDAAAGDDRACRARDRPRNARTVATASARATAPSRITPSRTCAPSTITPLNGRARAQASPRSASSTSAGTTSSTGRGARAIELAVGDDGGPAGIDRRAGRHRHAEPGDVRGERVASDSRTPRRPRCQERDRAARCAPARARRGRRAGGERRAVAVAGALERPAQDQRVHGEVQAQRGGCDGCRRERAGLDEAEPEARERRRRRRVGDRRRSPSRCAWGVPGRALMSAARPAGGCGRGRRSGPGRRVSGRADP